MVEKFLSHFRLMDEKEEYDLVVERISKDSVFRGTNLIILVFAIFIASLGLNVNSTAVIIGAMLISPLMGPIMGIGLGFGINDLALVKKAIRNFSFAVLVGLFTSFVYFLLTPLNDAYSELLARTFPTIYDVLIALFGGLAGMVANSSRQKGNVIPGVAIATALMPPLCTAGFGLATLNFNFFFGAFYLFTINTVFIALATFMTVKLLKFPVRHLADPKADRRSQRVIMAVSLLTLIPSVYFGYLMIQQNRFTRNANLFVEAHSSFEGNYLLNKVIDPQVKSITMVYGGKDIDSLKILEMKDKLHLFGLSGASLSIKQGISFLSTTTEATRLAQLTKTLEEKDKSLATLQSRLDSIASQKELSRQIYRELRIQYPQITASAVNQITENKDSSDIGYTLVSIKTKQPLSPDATAKLNAWLKTRLGTGDVRLIVGRE